MKNIFLLIFVLLFNVAFAQKYFSKTFCFKGYNLTVNSVQSSKSSDLYISGLIQPKFTNPFQNDIFVAKINTSHQIEWFKKFNMPIKFATSKTVVLSNNTILFHLSFDGKADEELYCFDSTGKQLWHITDVYADYIVDNPTEKAFMYLGRESGIVKCDYDGTMIWSKYFSTEHQSLFSQIAVKNNGNFLLSMTTNFNNKFDTLHIFELESKTAKIINKNKFYTSGTDSAFLYKIIPLQTKTIILLNNGLGTKHRGIIYTLDKNLTLENSQQLSTNIAKESNFENAIPIDNDKCVIYIQEAISDFPILSVFDAQKSKFESPFTKFPKNSSRTYNDLNFTYNNNQFSYLSGTSDRLKLIITEKIYNPINCQIDTVGFKLKNIVTFSNANTKVNIFDAPIVLDKNNTVLNSNTTKYKEFEICPTCFCPDTTFYNKKICEGKSYNFRKNNIPINLKKEGIYLDSSFTADGCYYFSQLDLKVTPRKTKTLNYYLCSTQPSVKVGFNTYNKAGVYYDTLTTKTSCDSVLTINIKDVSDLNVSLGSDKEILDGDKLDLLASTNYPDIIKKYTWLPVGTSSCDTCKTISVAPSKAQSYVVKAQIGGCFALDSINIKVLNQGLVFMPTAFSPNGDLINDVFRPYASESVVDIDYFIIFDRWGNQVFDIANAKPNDDNFCWNGTFRNQAANDGIYTYQTQVKLKNGKVLKFEGDVLLAR